MSFAMTLLKNSANLDGFIFFVLLLYDKNK